MFAKFAAVLALAGAAQAHFRLNYPLPRGNFVSADEPKFCGGYTDVTTNRTKFPLNGGFVKIRQGHPDWTMAVVVSTVANPNSFDSFKSGDDQQFVKPFTKIAEPGTFCFPVDIGSSGIAGIENGANVTIQVVVEGSDGNLYQCADLTLDSSLTAPPSDAGACTNETTTDGGHGHGASSSAHDHAPSATPSGAAVAGLNAQTSALVAALLGLLGVVSAF